MIRTLHGKLTFALLGLLAATGTLLVAVTLWTTQTYLQEVNQRLHVDVARHLVDEVLLIEDGKVNEAGLDHIFHMMMVINPGIEIYLLDPDGVILAYSAPPGKVKATRVALPPIERFLAGGSRLPFSGDDPRAPGTARVFSAARIGPELAPQGYLYVVLAGERYASVVDLLAGSHILRLSLGAAAAILVLVALLGRFAFRLLTRRLRSLQTAMVAFEASRFRDPPRLPLSGSTSDELDALTATFDRLAGAMSEQLERARSADVLRRELVANVSHDLRTPLASLTAFVETLLVKEPELAPAERRRYLAAAYRHAQSLAELVSRLFELAKLEARQTEAHPEPFSLAELLQDVAQKFELRAREQGVALRVDVPPDLPFVHADLRLVERMLDNLIDNALRHAPDGTVHLNVQPGQRGARVSVVDDGEGISADDLPFVFERYFRGRPEASSGSSGRTRVESRRSGLGLAIAQHIARLHGAHIEVESQLGRGTAFRFDLAYPRPGAAPGSHEPSPNDVPAPG